MTEYRQLALFSNPELHPYTPGTKWANECVCGEHMFHRNHDNWIDEEEMYRD